MPDWLQVFAANQPVTTTANALRWLILGEGALPPEPTSPDSSAWSAIVVAVFAPLAVRAYKRTTT